MSFKRLSHSVSLIVLTAVCLLPASAWPATHPDKPHQQAPSLPSTHFSAGSHVRREGRSQLLAAGTTILGRTELVAFPSSLGLCIENDHIPQATRAGGCGSHFPVVLHPLALAAWGYSASARATAGVTELTGLVIPTVTRVRVSFRINGRQYQARVLFSRVHGTAARLLHVSPVGIFSLDIPTCINGTQIRIEGFERSRRLFESTPRFQQRAACATGNGFVYRGVLSFGALPTLVARAQLHLAQ
jgi:hypothetical protein